MYLQPASLLVLLKAVYYLALYIDDNRCLCFFVAVPRIYYLTRERYAKQGDSITLRCNASGHPAPRATWIHKGTNTVIAYSSVTSFNFTGKASGGKYCCHVTNLCGDATNCTSVSVMGMCF